MHPYSVSTSNMPVLVGLSPTFVNVTELPLIIAAAAMKNAADEISPGTMHIRSTEHIPPLDTNFSSVHLNLCSKLQQAFVQYDHVKLFSH